MTHKEIIDKHINTILGKYLLDYDSVCKELAHCSLHGFQHLAPGTKDALVDIRINFANTLTNEFICEYFGINKDCPLWKTIDKIRNKRRMSQEMYIQQVGSILFNAFDKEEGLTEFITRECNRLAISHEGKEMTERAIKEVLKISRISCLNSLI